MGSIARGTRTEHSLPLKTDVGVAGRRYTQAMAIVKRFNSWLARHPAQTDGLLAGGLFGLVLLEAWLNLDIAPESFQGPAWWKIWVLAPLITLPLAWRRRFPLAVLLPVTPAFIVADWASIQVSSAGGIAMFIGILSAGAHG